ncbi:Orf147 [Heliothis zea nudivirus]|uniref:Orf147 n=1 Tax=Heliothis zea nudivirus 1 TaxID=3116536 RepID=Q8JKG6_9VIRU|nr:Orf147 [Heliothis zea nudivirus]AAN04439.1 Orf147 [Heliothis zea nudivirus]
MHEKCMCTIYALVQLYYYVTMLLLQAAIKGCHRVYSLQKSREIYTETGVSRKGKIQVQCAFLGVL